MRRLAASTLARMISGAGVTVIVPLRNEASSFDALHRSIEAQRRPADAVILVDAGSTDTTLDLARAACSTKAHWQVIEAGPATPGRARNVGIEAATTDWVALTDAGIVLDRFWLDRLARFVDADPALDVVYGSYEAAPGSWFTDCAALVYVSPALASAVGPIRDRSVASCLLRRELWARAGGFPDLRAAEDRIFLRHIDELHAQVAVSAEATVWWQLQPNLRSTFRRFRTYSRVNVLAAEQRYWHHRVRQMYVVTALFASLARLHDRRWLIVPVSAALLRAGRGIWTRRQGRPTRWALNPARLLTTLGITLTIDAATFTGWIEATVERSVA